MFEKVDLRILIRFGGLYQIKQVYRLMDDFYVCLGKDRYVKLAAHGGTSYKTMKWEALDIEEVFLLQKGIKLELVHQ